MARDEVFPGPWLKLFGCDSVCNICSDERVFRLICLQLVSVTANLMLQATHIVPLRKNVSNDLTAQSAPLFSRLLYSVVLCRCTYVSTAPVHPRETEFSISTIPPSRRIFPFSKENPTFSAVTSSACGVSPSPGTRNCASSASCWKISNSANFVFAPLTLNSWIGRTSMRYGRRSASSEGDQ